MFFFDIIIVNFKDTGIIIKALAGFYYVESDGRCIRRARGNFHKGQAPLMLVTMSIYQPQRILKATF